MEKNNPKRFFFLFFALALAGIVIGDVIANSTIINADVIEAEEDLLLAPKNQTTAGLNITNHSGNLRLLPAGFPFIFIAGFYNASDVETNLSTVSAWVQGNKTTGLSYENATETFVDWETLTNYPTRNDLTEELSVYPNYTNITGQGYLTAIPATYATGAQVTGNRTEAYSNGSATWQGIGDYQTGTQANNNYTAINGTVNTKITWAQADNGTFLKSYTETDPKWTGNQSLYPLTSTVDTWIQGNKTASSSAKVIGYDTVNNLSYLVIDFSSSMLTVASLQRITTAPTVNTTPTNGIPSAYNFPTAASIGGDGGFIMAGNTATNTATLEARRTTYFRLCGQRTATTNRREMIGLFKTGTTVVMNSTLTGILFKANTTEDGNLYALVCNAGTCSTSGSLGALDTNYNCYSITDNGATWNFWLNDVSVANISNSNEPTTKVSSIGAWIESTDATADVLVVNVPASRYESTYS
jgi:hypothetical protein